MLVDAFDLPAFLGINPGVCLALVSSAHAAYNTTAQACAEIFQRYALQHWLKEALYNNTLGLRACNTTHHQVEELLFIDLARSCAMAGADLVGADFQAGNRLRAAFITQQQGMIREERGRLLGLRLYTNHALELNT